MAFEAWSSIWSTHASSETLLDLGKMVSCAIGWAIQPFVYFRNILWLGNQPSPEEGYHCMFLETDVHNRSTQIVDKMLLINYSGIAIHQRLSSRFRCISLLDIPNKEFRHHPSPPIPWTLCTCKAIVLSMLTLERWMIGQRWWHRSNMCHSI